MLPKPGSGRKLNLSISAIRSRSSNTFGLSQPASFAAPSTSGVEDGAPCMPRVLWGDNASPLRQQLHPSLSPPVQHQADAEGHWPTAATAGTTHGNTKAAIHAAEVGQSCQPQPIEQEPDAAALHDSPSPVRQRPRRSRASGQPMTDPGAAWDMQQFMTSSQRELQQLQVGIEALQ